MSEENPPMPELYAQWVRADYPEAADTSVGRYWLSAGERDRAFWRALAAEQASLKLAAAEREEARDERDKAYRERADLVAFLASVYPSQIADAPDAPGWAIVYVDTPTGQMSWHVASDDQDLFDHAVADHRATWDGHTTMEKYQRLDALTVRYANAGGVAGIVAAAVQPVAKATPAGDPQ